MRACDHFGCEAAATVALSASLLDAPSPVAAVATCAEHAADSASSLAESFLLVAGLREAETDADRAFLERVRTGREAASPRRLH